MDNLWINVVLTAITAWVVLGTLIMWAVVTAAAVFVVGAGCYGLLVGAYTVLAVRHLWGHRGA